jgi:hypothetical protein
MSKRVLLGLFASTAAIAIGASLWSTRKGADASGAESPSAQPIAATENGGEVAELREPRAERAPADAPAVIADEAPVETAAVAVAAEETEEQRWMRETEGKSFDELRGIASGVHRELVELAKPHFDALEERGDFELVVSGPPPHEYSSRPEDNTTELMQIRFDDSGLKRLVLPEERHPELYERLRRHRWLQDRASELQFGGAKGSPASSVGGG